MARPLRINVTNGWYHITARGQNRERIYWVTRDRRHFLELVKEMTKRFGVEVHAYVLMSNHYHLLIRTPRANASRALQWLNQSYGMWWNLRHGRTGHVFQGRFKSILIEGGGWVLDLSFYLHFNPVAVKALGWGKREKKAEGAGLVLPTAEILQKRLETLREYLWSSYRGYAGYEDIPDWLSTQEVLSRVKDGREGYRHRAEEQMGQGVEESIWSKLKWGAVLGGEAFAESMRRGANVLRETRKRSELKRETSWEAIVEAVERVKGAPWETFVDRYGDWGRDLALWIARKRGGMSLMEVGERAGGLDYSSVSEAVRSFERRRLSKKDVRQCCEKVLVILNLEM